MNTVSQFIVFFFFLAVTVAVAVAAAVVIFVCSLQIIGGVNALSTSEAESLLRC